ncbi:hypothetical protein JCM8547_008855 [Rhodosporidiobolus lusitaniae]
MPDKVVLDVPPLILLVHAGALPLALLLVCLTVPLLAHLVLPRRFFLRVIRLLSSPSDGGLGKDLAEVEEAREWRADPKIQMLVLLGAYEALAWTAGSVWTAVSVLKTGGGKEGWESVGGLAGIALGWAVSTLLLLPLRLHPVNFQAPVPFLHFLFYSTHLVFLLLHIISLALHHPYTFDTDIYLTLVHGATLAALLAVCVSMPVQPTPVPEPIVAPTAPAADVPEREVDDSKDEIVMKSPEPSVTLGSWMIFSWVGGLLESGKKGKLGYRDVWQLPTTMMSEGLERSAARLTSTRVIPRIFFNNSLDLILSITLGLTGSALSYLSPYFLRNILDSLSSPDPNPALRQSAYIYALLAFLSQIAKAEVDLQQLSTERRAIIRAKTQLTGEVYGKALRRRDMSGVVVKKEEEEKKASGGGKNGKDGKKGADGKKKKALPEGRGTSSTGKIASIFGGDVNKVSMQLMSLSSIVGAPFELAIATFFLYQLLGWSTFVGLTAMAAAIPLNHMLVSRRMKIHRTMLSARDARLEVLNELIQAVRFIKSCATEEDWLARVFSARETELRHLLRTRMNNLMINALWNGAPDLVTVISFATYTLVQKKELTVSVAFTSLALFAMVRAPMTMLPMSIVNLSQTWVSIQRIEQFFGEQEIEPWVSALNNHGASSSSASDLPGVGIDNGTFVYSEEGKRKNGDDEPAPSIGETAALLPSGVTTPEPQFELKGINVSFPPGKLSLVCGATGSGKSSLFLALLGEMTTVSGTIRLKKGTVGSPLNEHGLYDGVAYSAQLPWLRHASIKENILFGSPFDKERYQAVTEACALRSDLAIFSAGDETEIGERGISLSGGQKARVALARAIYSRANTVFLDDPLSAVDSHTARHLFKCLRGPLLEHRTVVLVTHHISLCLSAAEYVVRMSEGRVVLQGKVNELDKAELTTELVEGDEEAEDAETDDKKEKDGKEVTEDDPREVEAAAAATLAPSAGPTREPSPSIAAPPVEGAAKSTGKIVETEERAKGRVKWKVYALYLTSAGWLTWSMMIFLIILGRVGRVADRTWFKYLGESYRSSDSVLIRLFMPAQHQLALTSFDAQSADLFDLHDNSSSTQHGIFKFPSASDNVEFYLIGYFLICVANLLITVVGILSAFQGSFRASRLLFTSSLRRVVYAPFAYFDRTPSGRILNRFSQDFNTIDGSLVDSFRITMTHLSSFVVNVVVIVVVSPSFILPAVLIVATYVYYAALFVRTSRDLRRLESNARSPIFSKFGETLQGIVTCRAFAAERRFVQELYKQVDTMQAVGYASAMANRFLLWRFDCLGAFAIGLTTVLALGAGASPGTAALAITSAQGLVQSIYWASRFVSQLEVDLNAVERVVQVLDIEQEPEQIVASNRPPASWPSSVGGISLENLTIAYAPNLPPVVKGVSIDIPPRAKVGLVGRTGSGKSTLAMSLLRFVDPREGRIVIDGIDVTKIGLNDLRKAVTLIPQEAVLFSGTVRSNLDPFNVHTDADCLEVLERTGLTNATAATSMANTPIPSVRPSRSASPAPGAGPSASVPALAETGDGRLLVPKPGEGHGSGLGEASGAVSEASSTAVGQVAGAGSVGRLSVTLETPVSAGGNNFSAGQRQLLALARALLRRSQVIIMDEATASVDFETDQKIQHVIRDEFADALVLTVAHRLLTIVDYDLILVLDQGKVLEYDSPASLLRKKEGTFRKMAEKAAEWKELRELAGLKEDE